MNRVSLVRAAIVAPLLLLAVRHAGAAAPDHPDQPILSFLDEVLAFHRQEAALAQLETDPADVVFADAAREQSRRIVQDAFGFARAAARLQPRAPAQPTTGAGGLEPDAITRMTSEAASRVDEAQASVAALQRRIRAARSRDRRALEAELAEARSELRLAQARQDALRTLASAVTQAGRGSAGGLLGQIDELERTFPEALPSTAPAGAPGEHPQQPATTRRAAPAGILGLAGGALELARKLEYLRGGMRATAKLRDAVERLRAPLVADLRATVQRGDALSRAPAGADPAVLAQRAQDIDRLTAHFKAVSGALVPLGSLAVLLDAHAATLEDWHRAADERYDGALRGLALHLGLVALAIAAILVASTFWKRATFRYVRDLRRRRQLMVLWRVVVAVAIALVLAFSFVTELGSLATFAGFITAGLAVALQNVILSVAAYFFLIGKYGIRVGDRVQIGGVHGDVLDIGLVRLHLMELRPDGLPTGRVVVFSNAVLFQPTANFFKQIPGSNFTWHQVTLTLSSGTDYRHAERRLMEAVERVYAGYRDRIARQHENLSQTLSVELREPRPESQLRLTEAGLEMTIRFPVPIERAAAVDDEMTRALVDALDREPRLKLAGSGRPTIEAVPQPAGA